MGDLIHTLPALSDAGAIYNNIAFDWMVEEQFKEIPSWHPLVKEVIPVAIRRWRKNLLSQITWQELRVLRRFLKTQQYDFIIDAQGLLKSALLTCFGKGTRAGLGWNSAREPLASLLYQKKVSVRYQQHAVTRMRALFAGVLDYSVPTSPPNFNLQSFKYESGVPPYVVFLHGTTWETKLWPLRYWQQLVKLVTDAGYDVHMTGGNDEEMSRAYRIAQGNTKVRILPRSSIEKIAVTLGNSQAVVAVDTGFGHLAAALGVPIISIYGATDARLTGALGDHSVRIQTPYHCSPCLKRQCQYQNISSPPCYDHTTPAVVFEQMKSLLK